MLENFVFRRNIIHLQLPEQTDLGEWKLKFAILKEILAKLGLTGLRFGKEKNANNNNLSVTQDKNNDKNGTKKISTSNKNDRVIGEERKISNSRLTNNGRRLNKVTLFQE